MTVRDKIDRIMMKSSLPYYSTAIISSIHICFNLVLGLPAVSLFDLFGIFPWLDEKVPKDWMNPNLKEIKELEDSVYFMIPLYLGLLMDWVMTMMFLNTFFDMNLFSQVFSLILVSLLFSSTFLVSHQLMHRNNKTHRFIATIHQVKCMYMHFTTEHLYGHHKNVATPLDPASAEKGISLYKFIPRSIVGSYKSAMKIDPRSVSMYTVCYVVYLSIIYMVFDFRRVILSLVAAFGGIWLLESVNYIEHYGLRRKQLPDGTYEKVTIKHSWNSPHRISNYFMFKLQRHSDHHQNSLKPYQTLSTYEASPQLPTGYLGCLVLVSYPSKWFQIMDPLVDQYMNSETTPVGTELKAMPASIQKMKDFNKGNIKVLSCLLFINVVIKLKPLLFG